MAALTKQILHSGSKKVILGRYISTEGSEKMTTYIALTQ